MFGGLLYKNIRWSIRGVACNWRHTLLVALYDQWLEASVGSGQLVSWLSFTEERASSSVREHSGLEFKGSSLALLAKSLQNLASSQLVNKALITSWGNVGLATVLLNIAGSLC